MLIKRFEDLECWQVARVLTKTIYGHTQLPKFSKNFKLTGQICSASVSIMNNISEGFDAKTNKEFIRFLSYARRSCSEVQNCLYVALDQEYITAETFQHGYDQCARTRKIIDGLMHYLKQTPRRTNGQTGKLANGLTGKRTNEPLWFP